VFLVGQHADFVQVYGKVIKNRVLLFICSKLFTVKVNRMDLNLKNAITELAPYLHGAYNFTIFLFLLYQASVGLTIRKERLRGTPPNFTFIKRHRKLGPLLVLGGIFGFLAGVLMVYREDGHVAEHPVHFAIGFLTVFLLILTFVISRQIRVHETKSRTLHLAIGIFILFFYSIQILLGLTMILSSE
jgi:hypothetical protein